MAGYEDAHNRFSVGICGAISACYDELVVVWEDYKGVEEDFSKEAVIQPPPSIVELLFNFLTSFCFHCPCAFISLLCLCKLEEGGKKWEKK